MKTHFLAFSLLVVSIAVKAQQNFPGLIERFFDYDLKLVNQLKKEPEFDTFARNINVLAMEDLRHVDSVDVYKKGEKLWTIVIYSEDYAYFSKNSFDLDYTKSDAIYNNIQFSIEMKKIIEDKELFDNRQFSVSVSSRPLSATSRRFIVRKIG